MPLEDPVALVEHGVISATVGLSANGASSVMFHPTSLDVRVDVVPIDGLGLYVDGVRINARGDGKSRDRGWRGAVGAHGAWWLGDRIGFGAIAEAAAGRDWTTDAGVRSAEVGRFAVTASPSLVVGERGAGAYAWIGPEVAAIARVRGASSGGGLEWPAPPVHVRATIGGELISDNLVGPGARGEAHARVGAVVRAGSTWGLGVWVGASW